MNVLVFTASPRENGNCEIILNRIVDKFASETVKINKLYIKDLSISFCASCGSCSNGSVCIIRDDLFMINKAFKDADVIIVISPLYFCNIPAQFKTIVDRCEPDWIRKYVLKIKEDDKKRKGIFIMCAAADIAKYFKCSRSVVKSFFNVKDIDYCGDVAVNGVEYKGDILKEEEKLKEIDALVSKVVGANPRVRPN